jgi:8-oxo-dGTP pyrophosphatase MutT (NUDIX family)
MSALTWAVAAVVTDDAGRVLLCHQSRGEPRHALPGGRLLRAESPIRAVVREIHAETGCDIAAVDLVGIYHLHRWEHGQPESPLPDVLVHVFRARTSGVPPAAPPAGCRLSWHHPDALPVELTPVTRAAVADAAAGRSGVLRDVRQEGGRPPVDEPVRTGPAGQQPAAGTGRAAPPPRTEPVMRPAH